MVDAIKSFFAEGDFWSTLVKVLVTAVLTVVVGLLCTLAGKLLAKFKHSKIMRHARIAVKAAEMKFPNEGKKMGPEKIAYVMDYLAITFPKIKNNQYLYNIAEAAVFELNKDMEKQSAEQDFKDKYGELPTDIISADSIESEDVVIPAPEEVIEEESKVVEEKSKAADNISMNFKSF